MANELEGGRVRIFATEETVYSFLPGCSREPEPRLQTTPAGAVIFGSATFCSSILDFVRFDTAEDVEEDIEGVK